MKKFVIMFAIGALVLAVNRPVVANPTMIGGPYIGNTWSITATAPGPYDLWAVRISPGYETVETFRVGPALDTGTAGWSMVLDGPLLASIVGPAGSINLNIYFAGAAPPALLEIDHALFNGQTKRIETHWVLANGSIYNPGGTWYHSNSWNPTRADVIPAPGAVLLGSIGAGLVGWLRRRRTL